MAIGLKRRVWLRAALGILVVPRRLRLPVACVGVLLTMLVGIAMMIRHQHRPSDVVGGALVGCTWGFAGVAALSALESEDSGRRRVA